MKLSDLISGYFEDRELQLSEATVKTYNFYFADMLDYWGDISVDELSKQEINKYLIHLRKGREKPLSKRSVYDRYVLLKSLFNWANEELGLLNVLEKMKPPDKGSKIIKPLSPAELRTLIDNLPDVVSKTKVKGRSRGRNIRSRESRFNAYLLTLLDSGLRVSELCDLTIGDYDPDTGKLFVRHGKGDKERIVYLGKKAKLAIWKYLTTRDKPREDEPLFSSENGTKLDRNNIGRSLMAYGRKLGIHLHPHRCRHTYAVNFLRNGGNIRQLQESLGHSTLEMVVNYTKLAEIDLEQARAFSPIDNL